MGKLLKGQASFSYTVFLGNGNAQEDLLFSHVLSCFSCLLLFATLWTVARHVPLSMAFSRKKYWSGLPFLLYGIFLSQRSNPVSCLLHWQMGSLPLAPPPILVVYFRHSGSMRGEEVSEVVARWVWARTQGMGSFSFHLPLRGI